MLDFYISFGQAHVHSIDGKTLDKDCIAVIQAEAYNLAQIKAMDMFGSLFGIVYEEKPDMTFYPKGLIKLN